MTLQRVVGYYLTWVVGFVCGFVVGIIVMILGGTP